MTSLCNYGPLTPKTALRRRGAIDKALDAELFKAIADPTRIRLIRCLVKCDRACSVTEIAECCDVDYSVVARHLATLARAGVLDSEREGRVVRYAARSETLSERFRAIAEAIDEWRRTPPEEGAA
jgi:ArsR family transcriptional regulator, arsenate/arsenite/antimonite-responsive transcriptional repressor